MNEDAQVHADAEPPALVTIEEAIIALRTSRPTLYTYINSGRLEAVKMGRRTYIKYDELKRFLDEELETYTASRLKA